MKHEFTELYKIKGDTRHIYSEKAVQFVNHERRYKAKDGDAMQMLYRVATDKPFRIYDEIGSKEYRLGYQYGEKTWFDTKEELEEYRDGMEKLALLKKMKKVYQLQNEVKKLKKELAAAGLI